MKASLKFWHKAMIKGRYVVELSIHDLSKNKSDYPDGIKYGLICVDLKTKKRVLFDNHHPKGPHMHIDDQEIDYQFIDEETLIDDFKQIVLEHLGVKL